MKITTADFKSLSSKKKNFCTAGVKHICERSGLDFAQLCSPGYDYDELLSKVPGSGFWINRAFEQAKIRVGKK